MQQQSEVGVAELGIMTIVTIYGMNQWLQIVMVSTLKG